MTLYNCWSLPYVVKKICGKIILFIRVHSPQSINFIQKCIDVQEYTENSENQLTFSCLFPHAN